MIEPSNVPNPSEVELYKTPDEAVPVRRGSRRAWPVAALVLVGVALGIGGYVTLERRARDASTAPALPEATPLARTAAPGERALGGVPEAVVVPALNESDGLVRDLVRRLTSHPSAAALLATDNLVRTFTVSVVNIASGRNPATHLRALRPPSRFHVLDNGEGIYIDPASYARYDSLAAAIESVDPAGAAQLYATLKPRIDEAYAELGIPDATFDQNLERAIVHLLRTPTPSAEIAVVQPPSGIGYAYADPRFERLSAAQRQFVRMGASNVRRIKSSLRQLALALGIPDSRLPAAS